MAGLQVLSAALSTLFYATLQEPAEGDESFFPTLLASAACHVLVGCLGSGRQVSYSDIPAYGGAERMLLRS